MADKPAEHVWRCVISKWLLSLVLFPFAASGALAAPACGQRDDVLAQLAARYKEAPIGVGLASNGGLIELLTEQTGTTWTLIISMPNGPTCLLAAGQDWQPQQLAVLDGPAI